MTGQEAHAVLCGIGAVYLYHANSVATSCTFLEEGGILSRDYVERNSLIQTPQPMSDAIDKKYGIWDRIFLDHVDIHARARRKRAPNHYGPVLFIFHRDVLLQEPPPSDIVAAKKNPIYWKDGEPDTDRWYNAQNELAANLCFGNFEKMLMILTKTGKIEFPGRRIDILLDDPRRNLSSGANAYDHAVSRLTAAPAKGGVAATIQKRVCPDDCVCSTTYARWQQDQVDFFFE